MVELAPVRLLDVGVDVDVDVAVDVESPACVLFESLGISRLRWRSYVSIGKLK